MNIGKFSAKTSKILATILKKNHEIAFEVGAKVGSTSVSKNSSGNFVYNSRCENALPHSEKTLSWKVLCI